jgi:hypothetical protein
MKILDDGTVMIEKGERFPFKCPVCGKLIAWQDPEAVSEIVCSCGHQGTPEEFSEVEYELRPVQ